MINFNCRTSVVTATTLIILAIISMAEIASCQEVPLIELPTADTSAPLVAGNHLRSLEVGELKRTALVHIPQSYQPELPIPVVLALHGAAMTGPIMALFSGLNETSEKRGFVVIYPNGTGPGPLLTWNAGGFVKGFGSQVDDVAFIRLLLDDIEKVIHVDKKRIFACGMSNGAMMCYRLAGELSDRIAAIAPVAGTMATSIAQPPRAVSVIHFHGTLDTLVPFDLGNGRRHPWFRLKSVEDSIQTWSKFNECDPEPKRTDELSQEGDELKVTRQTYGPGKDGSQVVLITIDGGGHTWPGQVPPVQLIGKSAMNISANELLWSFFEGHPFQ